MDMIEVLVLAKSQKPGFRPNTIICKKMKAEMTIFMGQPLFFMGQPQNESRNHDFYGAIKF